MQPGHRRAPVRSTRPVDATGATPSQNRRARPGRSRPPKLPPSQTCSPRSRSSRAAPRPRTHPPLLGWRTAALRPPGSGSALAPGSVWDRASAAAATGRVSAKAPGKARCPATMTARAKTMGPATDSTAGPPSESGRLARSLRRRSPQVPRSRAPPTHHQAPPIRWVPASHRSAPRLPPALSQETRRLPAGVASPRRRAIGPRSLRLRRSPRSPQRRARIVSTAGSTARAGLAAR